MTKYLLLFQVMFSVSLATAQTSGELQNTTYDPYYWINSKYKCDEMEAEFSKRFAPKLEELSKLSNLQLQEFAFVKSETCSSSFAKCKFFWCDFQNASQQVEVTPSNSFSEVAPSNNTEMTAKAAEATLAKLQQQRKLLQDKLLDASKKNIEENKLAWVKIAVPAAGNMGYTLSQPSKLQSGTRVFAPTSSNKNQVKPPQQKLLIPKDGQSGVLNRKTN
ncbi:MAG: hypothetical protein KBC84_01810 [Proteobacteria bacterium]|nr:hypothetical protein [Pseudomonadota bacterium]